MSDATGTRARNQSFTQFCARTRADGTNPGGVNKYKHHPPKKDDKAMDGVQENAK